MNIKFFMTLFIMYLTLCDEPDFNNLLKCNLQNRDISRECNIDTEFRIYQQALLNESNYQGCQKLEDWVDSIYSYPNVHPFHKIILDIVKEVNISSICELGAGCGKISKYIYAEHPDIVLTCVEHNSQHFAQMKENFQKRTYIIKPDIIVRAHFVKACLPDLSILPSNSYDLVFTCTVMMHLPFIPAIKSALEIYRLSKKYILHVENKNQGNSWYNMTVVLPAGMSSVNNVGIDYVRLYESLGVKTLKYIELQDPFSPATCIVYLGEK